MGKHVHRMSNVDLEAMTGTCALCGSVDVKIDGAAKRAACGNSYRAIKRAYRIKVRYGIQAKEWDWLLIDQSGRCVICNTPMRDPHLDHCHTTGQVRALLCRGCNLGIGNFEEDVERLRAAITYLESHWPM